MGRHCALALSEIPFATVHAAAIADLPDIHADPFNRALVAVARIEGLTLVTADKKVDQYPVDTLLF